MMYLQGMLFAAILAYPIFAAGKQADQAQNETIPSPERKGDFPE